MKEGGRIPESFDLASPWCEQEWNTFQRSWPKKRICIRWEHRTLVEENWDKRRERERERSDERGIRETSAVDRTSQSSCWITWSIRERHSRGFGNGDIWPPSPFSHPLTCNQSHQLLTEADRFVFFFLALVFLRSTSLSLSLSKPLKCPRTHQKSTPLRDREKWDDCMPKIGMNPGPGKGN